MGEGIKTRPRRLPSWEQRKVWKAIDNRRIPMSTGLIFPEVILNQHLVVLGKTGAGKSSALRHIVEHLLSRQKRVCIIDPKGDWNGLKVSADGQAPGYPAILFGNFKETAGQSIPA